MKSYGIQGRWYKKCVRRHTCIFGYRNAIKFKASQKSTYCQLRKWLKLYNLLL